jgi:16S rRNA processing protein RimM
MEPLAGDWVLLARLGRTRGLRGEIYADGWSRPDRYSAIRRVWLRRPDGTWLNEAAPFDLVSVRPMHGRLVVRLAGIDSISQAEALTGAEVVIPRSERPALADGEHYLGDLVGCEVFDRGSGSKLGTVTGWLDSGGPELLEVLAEGQAPERALWIPFARSICVEIDPAGRRILVDPPEGLLELNSEAPER